METIQIYTLQELIDWRGRIMLDIVADDFDESMQRFRKEVDKTFTVHPELNTQENRKLLGV